MSEAAIVQDPNSTQWYEDSSHLQLVPELADGIGEPELDVTGRPPKLTPEEAAHLLERGPFVGRVRAQETLLAFVRKAQLIEGHSGPSLPEYVEVNILEALTLRRRALKDFDTAHAQSVTRHSLRPETPARILDIPPTRPRHEEGKALVHTVLPPVRPVEPVGIPVSRKQPPAEAHSAPAQVAESPKRDLSWQEDGLCMQTDPEAFFPEKGGSTKSAKQVCLGCEVLDMCLEYALDNDERFGIWGGQSERERRKLKKIRDAQQATASN